MMNKHTNIAEEFREPVGRRRGVDMSGMEFGRLTVDKFAGIARGQSWWWCDCECGNRLPVRAHSLTSNTTTSCGCYARELTAARHRTHNKSQSGEYRVWGGMLSRCGNPNCKSYPRYGGRGISVCDAWKHSFEKFLEDVGPRPSPSHSLDRFPNKDGNYEPGNVRWATEKQQQRNRSSNKVIEFKEKSMTIVEWSECTGIPAGAISQRLASGWPVNEALTFPYGVHRTTYLKILASQRPLPLPAA